jgi:hypothetical protein
MGYDYALPCGIKDLKQLVKIHVIRFLNILKVNQIKGEN